LVICGNVQKKKKNGSSAEEEVLFNLLLTCKVAGALIRALADGSADALDWVASWLGSPLDARAAVGQWRLFQPFTLDWHRAFSRVFPVEPVAGSWQDYLVLEFPYHLYIKYDDNDSSGS